MDRVGYFEQMSFELNLNRGRESIIWMLDGSEFQGRGAERLKALLPMVLCGGNGKRDTLVLTKIF